LKIRLTRAAFPVSTGLFWLTDPDPDPPPLQEEAVDAEELSYSSRDDAPLIAYVPLHPLTEPDFCRLCTDCTTGAATTPDFKSSTSILVARPCL